MATKRVDQEHRKQDRVSCALAVQVHAPSEDVLLFTYATNISHLGVYVRANRPLPAGAEVRLDLQPGTASGRVAVDGVVVRSVESKSGLRGMGIAFMDSDPEVRAALRRLIARLDGHPLLTVADPDAYSNFSSPF